MLRAGALFVAVTISFVLAVLISLLIVLAFHHKIRNRENLLQKKLERNVASTLIFLMSDTRLAAEQENGILDLYGEGTDSVEMKKSSWGIFEVVSVKAFSGKYSLSKTVQYGYRPDDMLASAVYLADLSRPLNLCGKTNITGTCYLPPIGVKKGYLEGKGYERSTLINGTIRTSRSFLPELNKEIIEKLKTYQSPGFFSSGNYMETDLRGRDSIIHSFLEPTLYLRYESISLSDKYLSGNIILYSDKGVFIGRNTQLQDVMIIAPSVIFKKGFTGNVQAFATDSIIVEEACVLKYPSALGIIKLDHKTQQPFIKLMKNASVSGFVFTNRSEQATDLLQTLITLETQAMLSGQLYADGFADIRGEVNGMVWCNKFLLKTKSSTYENHLMDAVINLTKLSTHYVGPGLLATGKKKKIVKWLE